jgi:hypothetical protein
MNAFAELLQTPGLGHWLMVAGGVLIVLGALGLLIRRYRRSGSEVEDEVTRQPDAEIGLSAKGEDRGVRH